VEDNTDNNEAKNQGAPSKTITEPRRHSLKNSRGVHREQKKSGKLLLKAGQRGKGKFWPNF